ncbi:MULTISPECIES: PDZ domain-containing protein [Microbulbifer]|uniref:PDZ domain-containing protein n=1 Tax=Microbulbifer TaxID=48073 RepID=UPI0018D2148C|nr:MULTISPECIES: PDZ domain-containing protein [Microbulbifer]
MNSRITGVLIAAATIVTITAGAASLWPADRQAANPAATAGLQQNERPLRERVELLEQELRESAQIQRQLLELVEELRQSIEGDMGQPAGEARPASSRVGQSGVSERPRAMGRRQRLQQHRQSQMQRLLDAGMDPGRAQFVLEKTERFQFEHTRLSYQYRHMADKSSEEARALRQQLEIHSNPRRMFSHLLSAEEFELYLEANGGRQEININRVVPDTPAQNAGLRAGDRIISYNGERIFHMGDLRQQVYRVPPGETVAVEVQRAGSNNRETIYVPSGPLGIQG